MGTCNDLLLIVLQTFFLITFALVYNCQLFSMDCRYYSKKCISSQEFTVVLAAQLIIPRIDNDNRKCKNIQCYLLYNRLNCHRWLGRNLWIQWQSTLLVLTSEDTPLTIFLWMYYRVLRDFLRPAGSVYIMWCVLVQWKLGSSVLDFAWPQKEVSLAAASCRCLT